MAAKGRVRGGRRWMDEHVSDPYVQRAQAEGFRSRAAYKLAELADRDRLLAPGMVVVDLGAAPGSWSQIAARRAGGKGLVVAVDLLPIEPLAGVTVIEGDFAQQAVQDRLLAVLGGRPVDLVLSDMAPNISGIPVADRARAAALAELARDFAIEHLRPGGALVVKLFQSGEAEVFLKFLRPHFDRVSARKPLASRERSSEVYAVARGFRGPADDFGRDDNKGNPV